MKKIPLFFICFLFTQALFAQCYQLELYLSNGAVINFPVEEIRKITFDEVTDIDDASKLLNVIKTFKALQNYPNPFNPSTAIQYQLPQAAKWKSGFTTSPGNC